MIRLWCAHCLHWLEEIEQFGPACVHCGGPHIERDHYLDEKQYGERKFADDQAERDARESGLIR